MKTLVLILGICSISTGYSQNNQFADLYSLNSPNEIIELPEILYEISGLTDIDSEIVACIQDELGIIFNYNLVDKEVVEKYRFGNDGDYEGITFTGSYLYILRSDGMLFECSDLNNPFEHMIDSIKTNIPAKDNEGLCYDKLNDRLLVGCKSKIGKGPEFKNTRVVYGFDLVSKQLLLEPVLVIDLLNIISFAEKNRIDLPTRIRKKDKEEITKIKIGISALAIHPTTNEIIILSAVDHLMLIYNQEGLIQNIIKLDPNLFQKAEGITFMENGDMLISNEGKDSKPTLLKFNILKGNQ